MNKKHAPQKWCIIFDSYPVWLWSLNKSLVITIYFPEIQSWSDLRSRISQSVNAGLAHLYDGLANAIGRKRFVFSTTSSDAIYLVSGLVETINKYLSNQKGLGILEQFKRGQKLPPLALNLIQIQHRRCGGTTTFRTLWCFNWTKNIHLPYSLNRTIRHFLDYSNRKGSFVPQSELSSCVLKCTNILPYNDLNNKVHILDHKDKLLLRPLSPIELGKMWGMNEFQCSSLKNQTNLPSLPVHITDAVLLQFLSLLPHSAIKRPRTEVFNIPTLVAENGGMWLPNLNRVLPHTWRLHAEITDKAARNDNAPVNYGLWNHQILALFLHLTEPILDTFRRFFLQIQRRQFYLKFLR